MTTGGHATTGARFVADAAASGAALAAGTFGHGVGGDGFGGRHATAANAAPNEATNAMTTPERIDADFRTSVSPSPGFPPMLDVRPRSWARDNQERGSALNTQERIARLEELLDRVQTRAAEPRAKAAPMQAKSKDAAALDALAPATALDGLERGGDTRAVHHARCAAKARAAEEARKIEAKRAEDARRGSAQGRSEARRRGQEGRRSPQGRAGTQGRGSAQGGREARRRDEEGGGEEGRGGQGRRSRNAPKRRKLRKPRRPKKPKKAAAAQAAADEEAKAAEAKKAEAKAAADEEAKKAAEAKKPEEPELEIAAAPADAEAEAEAEEEKPDASETPAQKKSRGEKKAAKMAERKAEKEAERAAQAAKSAKPEKKPAEKKPETRAAASKAAGGEAMEKAPAAGVSKPGMSSGAIAFIIVVLAAAGYFAYKFLLHPLPTARRSEARAHHGWGGVRPVFALAAGFIALAWLRARKLRVFVQPGRARGAARGICGLHTFRHTARRAAREPCAPLPRSPSPSLSARSSSLARPLPRLTEPAAPPPRSKERRARRQRAPRGARRSARRFAATARTSTRTSSRSRAWSSRSGSSTAWPAAAPRRSRCSRTRASLKHPALRDCGDASGARACTDAETALRAALLLKSVRGYAETVGVSDGILGNAGIAHAREPDAEPGDRLAHRQRSRVRRRRAPDAARSRRRSRASASS